jgi:hypothetical protein
MSDAPAPPPAPAAAGSVGLVTAACILALIGVAFSLAHFLWPTPLLFALFMIVGQGSFGLALLLYVVAIFRDLRKQKVL